MTVMDSLVAEFDKIFIIDQSFCLRQILRLIIVIVSDNLLLLKDVF